MLAYCSVCYCLLYRDCEGCCVLQSRLRCSLLKIIHAVGRDVHRIMQLKNNNDVYVRYLT
jgi:hypothetical protein